MALRDDDKHNIPELIYDVGTNVTYRKGRFFGKVSLSLSVSFGCYVPILFQLKFHMCSYEFTYIRSDV